MIRERAIWLTGVLWLGAIGAGMYAWERYENTPSATSQNLNAPASSTPGPWRLNVFVHPHCPCTRTAFVELEGLHRDAPNVAVRVVFVRPEGSSEGWEHGTSWNAAGKLDGIEAFCDSDGRLAREFGAETSGEAVLIDPNGRIVFRGGLTRGRGRIGESLGQHAVLDWTQRGGGASEAPVFGCPLFNSNQ